MKEEQLIFIISQPRSGSTYLQSLISNHSQVNTVSEPWLLLNFASILKPELNTSVFDEKLTARALIEFKSKIKDNYFNNSLKKFILEIYSPFLKDHKFFIDKTPRYWEIVNELYLLFPKSKFIILTRNPIDVSKSIVKTWGLTSLKHLSYYHRDLLFAPKVLENFIKQNKGVTVYELSYEDLVNNKQQTLKLLFDWIGISFHEGILDTSKNFKYKGELGDPSQNEEQQVTEYDSEGFEDSSEFQSFLLGYKEYLKTDKMLINDSTIYKYNTVFNYYLKLSGLDENLNVVSYKDIVAVNKRLTNENVALKNSKSFKLGNMLINPISVLAKLFR